MEWTPTVRRNFKRMAKVCFIGLVVLFMFLIHYNALLIAKYRMDIRDYPEIRDLATELTKDCNERSCYYDPIRDYVLNVRYRDDGLLGDFETNDPLFTIANGGDCDNKAILAIDLLKSLGEAPLYIIIQEGRRSSGEEYRHACWMGRPFDEYSGYKLYNCDDSSEITHVARMV